MANQVNIHNLRAAIDIARRAALDDGTHNSVLAALEGMVNDIMPSHLAPFGYRDATRLAHDTLSVYHRQLTESFITLRACQAKLSDEREKRIYTLSSKKEMLKIIDEMEAITEQVPDSEVAFHTAYNNLNNFRGYVEHIESDGDISGSEDDEIDDGRPVPVPSAKRLKIEERRFNLIPQELVEAIQSFLPVTDRICSARVSHVFHRSVQPFVSEQYYQNIREFNDFYCCLWQTFGANAPIGENRFTWHTTLESYELLGSRARDIPLNNEKIAFRCAITILKLLEMEATNVSNRGYIANQVGPAVVRIIQELAPSVSASFQKILRESLETANLIFSLNRHSENKPDEWQNAVDSLIDAHRYSHAMLVAENFPEREIEVSCEIIKRVALSDHELAVTLASRFLFMQHDFEEIVKIVQAWPDETHAAFKDEILLKIQREMEIAKYHRLFPIDEALLLEIQHYLEERRVLIPSVEPVESKEEH